MHSFDAIRREVDTSGQLDAADRYQQKAWDVLSSAAARDAFDLDKEPMKLRDRYGFMPAFDPKAANRCGAPNWAQRMLLGSVTESLINHLPTSLLVAPVGVAAAALPQRRQRQLVTP